MYFYNVFIVVTIFLFIFALNFSKSGLKSAPKVQQKSQITKQKSEKVMTQQKFQQLTGLQVEAQEYRRIEEVYMSTQEEKQEFCQMWKDATEASRKYMLKMAETINDQAKYTKKQANAHQQIVAEREATIEELLDAAFESTQSMSDPKLRKVCIEHMGKAEYLRKMLDKGYDFWEEDKQMLSDILQEYID